MIEPDNGVPDVNYHLSQASTIQPTFQGKGAKRLGIEGTWNEDAYRNLFKGYSPDGQTKLAARIQKDRRGAVDWTFNRSKSVAMQKLLAGDTRIDDVETKAELKAMRMLEKQARVLVRKQSALMASKAKMPKAWRYPARYSDNLIYVGFRHPDNRLGQAHSHTHYVIMNLSHDKEESQWKKVELGYVDRKGICEAYHKELAKGLRKLGYQVSHEGNTVDIVGVPKDLQDAHSGRRDQAIAAKEKYKEKGLSKKGWAKVQLFDRPEKLPDMPLEERRKGWVADLSKEQFKTITGLVKKARDSVRLKSWYKGMGEHLDKIRRSSIQEREIEKGRSR